MPETARVLIVSPVRNEADHLRLLAESLAAQTRPPDAWVVVDDGSDDGTPELLAELAAQIPFLSVVTTPPRYTRDAGDRHAVAAAPRAFNWGLRSVDWTEFSHIGKLDGDIELPPDYFERLLEEFDRDPSLGIGGGVVVELIDSRWVPIRTPPHHVRGALKLYSRECFAAIGGIQERLGWDGIDQTYARMRGFRTVGFAHLVARHHRECGTSDGSRRGLIRFGETYYVLRASLPWVILKSASLCAGPQGVMAGAACLYGYLRGRMRSIPRVEDPEYVRFVRRDERERVLRGLAGRVSLGARRVRKKLAPAGVSGV